MSNVGGTTSVSYRRPDDTSSDDADAARDRAVADQARKAADAEALRRFDRAVWSATPLASLARAYGTPSPPKTPSAPLPASQMTEGAARDELEMLLKLVGMYGSVTPPKATTDRIAALQARLAAPPDPIASERAFLGSMQSGSLTPDERSAHEAALAALEHQAALDGPDGDAKKDALYQDLAALGDKKGCRADDSVDSLQARRDALVAKQRQKETDADEKRPYMGAHGEQGTLDSIAQAEQSTRWNDGLGELDAIQGGPLGAVGSLVGHALGVSDETRRGLAGLGAIGDGVAMSFGADGRESDRLSAIEPELKLRRGPGLSVERLTSLAREYTRLVESNQKWNWDENVPGGASLSLGQRREVREFALHAEMIPRVPMKPGTNTPDFAKAGLVLATERLQKSLWAKTDAEQFAWLDARIPGGRPPGTTWHHSDEPGIMELVPFGIHNVTSHDGGRAQGSWANGPRK